MGQAPAKVVLEMVEMNIWDLQANLSRRLMWWSGLSAAVGLFLIAVGGGFWRAFGIQAFAWGAIDGAIALLGRRASTRRRALLDNPLQPGHLEREARNLRRLLWINAGLDVIYVIAGMALALTMGVSDTSWRGHGVGIVVQGAFLLVFDLVHAQRTPVGTVYDMATLFQDPEHRTFLLQGGKPAALLVHGFPGTPAEMRPLGEALHRAGWTVRGLLLPGFGPEINALGECTYEDWLVAVEGALRELRQDHAPVLLVGYSMGGALSIAAAARQAPDGLVLLAPFWRLGSSFQRAVGRVLGPFLPRYWQPLKKADLSDPKVRDPIAELMPSLNLDDPGVQDELRRFSVPLSLLRQVDRAGRAGYRAARYVDIPMLVVQGKADSLVKPETTEHLRRRFSRAPIHVVLDAGHDLIDPAQREWTALVQAVHDFAATVEKRQG